MSTSHEPAEPTCTSDAQRDDKGQFRKGNRGGPGDPFARRRAHLRHVLLDAVSDEELRPDRCKRAKRADERGSQTDANGRSNADVG
jgi:hypothetical protein